VTTRYYGWRILGALCFLMCVNMAFPIYGASVLNTATALDLRWDRQSLGLLIGINMLTNGLTAPLVAVVVNRFGARFSLTIGSFLMICSTAAMATVVSNSWQGVIAFGLVGGIAGAFGSVVPCQATLAAWFSRRRARALSILYSATGVGGFIAPALFGGVIAASGGRWQLGWWTFALFALGALATTLLFVKNTPADAQQSASDESPAEVSIAAAQKVDQSGQAAIEWSAKEALRSPMCWLMFASMASLMAGGSFYIAHGQVLLRDLGYSAAGASASLAVMAGASLLGNMIIGAYGDRVGPRRLLAGALLVYALGLLLLAHASGTYGLYVYAPVMGIGFGAAQVGAMAMLSHLFGTKPFASLTGVGLLIQTLAGSIVPIVAGAYFDTHHTYTLAIYLLLALNVGVGVLIFAARRPLRDRLQPGG
jgi:MFS family permease